MFHLLFSFLCFRVQLEPVIIIIPTFDRASDKAVMTKIDGRDATRKADMNSFCFYFCTYACTYELETSL